MNDYSKEPTYERAMLVRPGLNGAATRKALEAVLEAVDALPTTRFDEAHISDRLSSVATRLRIKQQPLFSALSVTITGHPTCHDLFGVIAALGKERVMKRIRKAIRELMVVA